MTARQAARGPGGGLDHVTIVRVGSENAAKLEAVRGAFAPFVADVRVEPAAVSSQVSEQPVGFEEIVAGARNRAHAAWRAGPCTLAVGIEDGLVELPGLGAAPLNIGAAVVTDGRRDEVGFSSAFAYPMGCSEPALRERAPIGDLFDAQWASYAGDDAQGGAPSGRGIGNIGKLTLGVLPRSEYGRHAVLCALLPFLHPDLYPGPLVSPGIESEADTEPGSARASHQPSALGTLDE